MSLQTEYADISDESEYKQCIVEEHQDLADRLIKLQAFQYTPAFGELPANTRSLMEKQAQLMYELTVVLSSRIAAF